MLHRQLASAHAGMHRCAYACLESGPHVATCLARSDDVTVEEVAGMADAENMLLIGTRTRPSAAAAPRACAQAALHHFTLILNHLSLAHGRCVWAPATRSRHINAFARAVVLFL